MKKILEWIIFILGAAFALFAFIYKDDLKMIVMVGAIFLIILGILLIIDKNKNALLVLILGCCLEISYLLFKYKIIDSSTAIIFMFIFSLFCILVLSIIKYFMSIKSSLNTHKMEIDATIVDLVKNPNFEKDVYIPLLEYKVKSEYFEFNYISQDNKYVPKIGDIIKIYVNPNDYYDVYIPPSKKVMIKGIAGTIFIMLACLLLLIDIFI